MKYYAVKVGYKTGIFDNWEECKASVDGFTGAVFKSFKSLNSAEEYLNEKKEKNMPLDIIEMNEEQLIQHSLQNPDTVFAFVDGSYNEEYSNYSSGVYALLNGEIQIFSEKGTDFSQDAIVSRNIAGEVYAAQRAIKFALTKRAKTIVICYDYMGIEAWATNDWKANKRYARNYKEFVMLAKQDIEIKFLKVEGHSGIFGNEMADNLAAKAFTQ